MISQDADHIVIVPENLVIILSYEQWKEKVSFTDTRNKIPQEQDFGRFNVEEEILRFNIESKIPIECMTCLSALKQKKLVVNYENFSLYSRFVKTYHSEYFNSDNIGAGMSDTYWSGNLKRDYRH